MKIKIVNLALLLVALLGTLAVLSAFPSEVPVHFGFDGTADRWGSKYEFLIMPVIMLVMDGVWLLCDHSYRKKLDSDDDKERAEAKTNLKVMAVTFTSISVMFLIMNFLFLYMAYSQLDPSSSVEIDLIKIVNVVMGISFIVLGNVIPKSKSNSTVGFRLPWTRFNDVTWAKCNRFSGYVMVICGFLTAILGLIFPGNIGLMVMLLLLVGSIIPMTIYAYLVYQDEVKKAEK